MPDGWNGPSTAQPPPAAPPSPARRTPRQRQLRQSQPRALRHRRILCGRGHGGGGVVARLEARELQRGQENRVCVCVCVCERFSASCAERQRGHEERRWGARQRRQRWVGLALTCRELGPSPLPPAKYLSVRVPPARGPYGSRPMLWWWGAHASASCDSKRRSSRLRGARERGGRRRQQHEDARAVSIRHLHSAGTGRGCPACTCRHRG